FVCVTVGEYLTAHLTRAAPLANTLQPDVPADLAVVIAKCLEKEPNKRFRSAEELEAALAACACATDWSAPEAAKGWVEQSGSPAVSSALAATLLPPERTPT